MLRDNIRNMDFENLGIFLFNFSSKLKCVPGKFQVIEQ